MRTLAIIIAVIVNFASYQAFSAEVAGGNLVREGNNITHGELYVCKVKYTDCKVKKVSTVKFKKAMKQLREKFNYARNN